MMNTSRTTKVVNSCTLLGILLVGAQGCSKPMSKWKFANMFDLDKGMPWEEDEDAREGTPVRVDGTWIDTVRYQEGQPPQRGFGGKLMFYEKDSNQPIKAEGELVVYAFDESNRDPIDNRPTRRYVFPPDQFALHMSQGDTGPSYSFFLPWDNAPGPQTEVSLICRFVPTKGAVCVSEQTRHLLPGTVRPDLAAASGQPGAGGAPQHSQGPAVQPKYQQLIYEAEGGPATGAVQRMSFESAGGQAPARMTTTSISLPSNFRMPSGTAGGPASPANASLLPNREPANLPPQNAMPMPASVTPPATVGVGQMQPAPAFYGASFHSTPTRPQFVPIGRAQLGGPLVSSFAGAYSPPGAPTGAPQMPVAQQPFAQPAMNQSQPAATMPQMNASPRQFAMPQMAPHIQPAQMPQQHGFNQGGATGVSPAPGATGTAPMPGVTSTTVSYLSPQDSLRWEQGRRSSGYQPSTPPAPSPPVAR